MSNIFQEEKDLHPKVLEEIKKYNLKQINITHEMCIHYSTLSQWVQNKGKIRYAAKKALKIGSIIYILISQYM